MDHPLYAMMDGEDGPAAHANGSSGSGSSSGGSVLQELLVLCGVSSAPQRPSAPYPPFVLSYPPHRVRLLLESELPRHAERTSRFLAELTEQCSQATQLRRVLQPTAAPSLPPLAHSPQASAGQQDSLIRIALNVLPLQRPLIDWLLEQLLANEDEWLAAEGIHTSVLSQRALTSQALPAHCLPRLLIDQLRLLDVVYDSEALCSKLQEVVDALTTVKAELISALPDILLDPSYHDRMADCLIAQMSVSGVLLLPVLDCLSRLHLTSRQKERTVAAVQPLVASVKDRSLPALIRFLLQMTSADSVAGILDTIRQHMPQLAEGDSNNGAGGGGKRGKEEREQEVSGAVLIVEALRSGLQQNALACKAYVDLLKASSAECKAADVLILFIIHSLPHTGKLKQRAADMLCKKLLSGSISPALLHSSIASHVSCVRPMFDSVAVLAEQLVRRQVDRAVREAGGCMQVDLFRAFDDRAQRMTLVQSWLQQLGSCEAVEMDSALHCLQQLSRTASGVRSLAAHFEYFRTVLQYLDSYKLVQIRTLFQILAALAFKNDAVATSERDGRDVDEESGGSGGSGCHPFDSSLLVFVQKELYAPSLRDQRIGIVAVVALMQPVAEYGARAEQRVGAQQHPLPHALRALLDQLFASLEKCTARSLPAQSFLYDELSLSLDSHRLLNIEVLQRIQSHFTSRYQPHLFVPRARGEHPLQMTVDRQTVQLKCADQLAGAELTANRARCSFNIVPTLLQLSPDRQLMTLPAELRLLAACSRADRPLDDFLQLLVAPFALPAPLGRNAAEWSEQFKQQSAHVQRVLISSHFHTVQCLREIINAFSSPHLQLDPRDRENVAPCLVHRMQQLVQLEDELRVMLRCTPDFTAQQLLSMADSTDEAYQREMGTLDGSMKADDSNRYTLLNGKVHIAWKKKQGKSSSKRRKRAQSSSSSSDEANSADESDTEDSEREDARKKKKKQAAKAKAQKQRALATADEDKPGPFDAVIRPLLRPLTLDVTQLLCNPLSKNLAVAAEVHRRAVLSKKQAQQEAEVDQQPNPLLLYLPPGEATKRNAPHLSVSVLRYLLTELHRAMEPVLSSASSYTPLAPPLARRMSPSAVIPSSPAVDSPASLLAVLSPVLRGVHDHFLVLSTFLSSSDVDDDAEVNRDVLDACLIACVHVIHLIFNCPSLTAPASRAALTSAVVDLLGMVRQKAGDVAALSQLGEQSVPTLCDLLLSRLRSCLHSLRCMDDAVAVVAVMQEVHSLRVQLSAEEEDAPGSEQAAASGLLHSVAKKLLEMEWTKKSTLRKQNVGELVALLVRHASEPHATMQTIVTRMTALAAQAGSGKKKGGKKKRESDEEQEEEEDDDGSGHSRPYKQSLTRQSVPVWLLPLIEACTRLLSAIDVSQRKAGTAQLEQMRRLVLLAANLLSIAKQYPRTLTLHKHCIRLTLRMLGSFSRQLDGMGRLLKSNARQRFEAPIKQTLGGIQQVTRAFNALCVHVKEQQVGSLLSIMPKAKMAYEKWYVAQSRAVHCDILHAAPPLLRNAETARCAVLCFDAARQADGGQALLPAAQHQLQVRRMRACTRPLVPRLTVTR